MDLGCFSVSLPVKDLQASKAFYEKLGFEVRGGVEEQGWLVMKNGLTNIGLFQDMFEEPILTFNPGWTHEAKDAESFTDIRQIQAALKAQGVAFEAEAEPGEGPAHFIIKDPDGNTIMLDQHR